MVFPKPFGLRWQVPVKDVTFRVLETPGNNNDDVTFADPCTLLNLPFDPAHPFYPVLASDTYMVCSHHQVGAGKLFPVFLLGKPDAYERCPIRV